MGVQLGSLIKGETIELDRLHGKFIAIDAFNTLYQFLSIIRDKETGQPLMDSKGRVTSHLSGLFYRTARLVEAGIKPIYVFDGQRPRFKEATVAERSAIKSEAERRWKEAMSEGRKEDAVKAAKMTARLTGEMIEQSKRLLDCMGIQCVQALGEGEAQCAFMCREKLVYATASQDWDSLLFGSPRLVRNLSISGKKRIPKTGAYVDVSPEMLELSKVLQGLGISREQLIALSLLVGTDYNPGVHGIGPKTALKIVLEEKKLDRIIAKAVEKGPWEGPDPASVMDYFLNPPSEKVEIRTPLMKPDKVISMLVDEFEFSRERIEKAVRKLAEKKPAAGSLGKWLK
ncbi:MAG: flap endonuclease-1 [Candidatus Aenigmatarchaeota archaeon]